MPFVVIHYTEVSDNTEVLDKLDALSDRLDAMDHSLAQLVAQGESIMADLATLREIVASVHVGLDNIHADILRILAKVDETGELHDDLVALDARVQGIAAIVPEEDVVDPVDPVDPIDPVEPVA